VSTHGAVVSWTRGGAPFADGRYSRAHTWRFDGGIDVPASASPLVVPLPQSREDAVDPEEAFVASLASCHMLWFLSLAAEAGLVVESYEDSARGEMGRDERHRLAIVRVELRPHVEFGGPRRPADAEVAAIHHAAHEACFLANSVRCEVAVVPR
jgi:organic hydroperoxide reductase OsmC/OhrA